MALAASWPRGHRLRPDRVPLAGHDTRGPHLSLRRLRARRDGVVAIWAAFNASGGDAGPRWWLGLSGVVSILAGIVAFAYTGMTALVLLMFIAVWAIIIGALQLYAAVQLRKVIENEWLLVLSSLFSIAFGAVLIAWPSTGALAVIWTIAWYAVLFGCLLHRPSVPAEDVQADLSGPARPAAVNSSEKVNSPAGKGDAGELRMTTFWKPRHWAVPFSLVVLLLCTGQAPLPEPVTDQETELGQAVCIKRT